MKHIKGMLVFIGLFIFGWLCARSRANETNNKWSARDKKQVKQVTVTNQTTSAAEKNKRRLKK